MILVVDDERLNRRLIGSLFKALGWPVVEAADGLHALEAYQQHGKSIQMVLMDLQMPRMDGVQASATLRRLEAAAGRPAVPIVACTTEDVSPGSPTWQACMEAGMNAAMGKPLNLQQAANMLQQHLRD